MHPTIGTAPSAERLRMAVTTLLLKVAGRSGAVWEAVEARNDLPTALALMRSGDEDAERRACRSVRLLCSEGVANVRRLVELQGLQTLVALLPSNHMQAEEWLKTWPVDPEAGLTSPARSPAAGMAASGCKPCGRLCHRNPKLLHLPPQKQMQRNQQLCFCLRVAMLVPSK